MNTRHKGTLAASALLPLVLMAACSVDTDGDNAGDKADQPLKFGSLLAETGTAANLGNPMEQGVRFAVEDINAAGGVLGQNVTLSTADSAGDPTTASQAIESLFSDSVTAIMGAETSAVTLAVLDRVATSRTLMCSGSNTADELTDYPDDDYFFRTSTAVAAQAPALATIMKDDGRSRAVLVGRGDAFGQGFVDKLEVALPTAGLEVAKKVIYDPNNTNFDSEVAAIAQAKPDAVVIIGFEEMAKIIQGMVGSQLDPNHGVGIYGVDAMADDDLWKRVSPNNPAVLDGVRGLMSATSADSEFLDRFKAFAPEIDSPLYVPQQYDCAVITALAAESEGSTRAEDLRKSVLDVTRSGTECNTYSDCLSLVKDGEDIMYVGPSGPLELDDVGDPTVARFSAWTMDDESRVQRGDEYICKLDKCAKSH